MLPETKPSNCRNVLRDSGQPYPRSGCAVCKNGGLMGCPYEKENVTGDEEIADALAITEHTLSPHLEALLSTWPEHKVIKLLKLKVKLCHGIIDSLTLALNGRPPMVTYAYIDDKNRLVKISGHVYFDGGFVDANSEIPDSWKTLVLVEKVGA